MRRKAGLYSAGIVTFVLIMGVIWYCIAADYSYDALAGTYDMHFDGETATLVLKADHTFKERLVHEGGMIEAQGTWRRVGEGGIVFSKEFLILPGQAARADGQVDADARKVLGLFPSIHFDSDPNGPFFKRRAFSPRSR